mmetsp:Transcript_11561/g.34699  ORF Transcript_11561/g.34699 Transcript_11561/m.34699 type:complete len:210 (+) Transcript_11561:1940-2569(+)
MQAGLLSSMCCHRRLRGNDSCHLAHSLCQRSWIGEAVSDEAPLQSLLATECFCRQSQFPRPSLPNQSEEPLQRPQVSGDAQINLLDAKCGLIRTASDVTCRRKVNARPYAVSLHCSDHGQAALFACSERILHVQNILSQLLPGPAGTLRFFNRGKDACGNGQVDACAEAAATASQQHNTHARLGLNPCQGLGDLAKRIVIESVGLLWTM